MGLLTAASTATHSSIAVFVRITAAFVLAGRTTVMTTGTFMTTTLFFTTARRMLSL